MTTDLFKLLWFNDGGKPQQPEQEPPPEDGGDQGGDEGGSTEGPGK